MEIIINNNNNENNLSNKNIDTIVYAGKKTWCSKEQ